MERALRQNLLVYNQQIDNDNETTNEDLSNITLSFDSVGGDVAEQDVDFSSSNSFDAFDEDEDLLNDDLYQNSGSGAFGNNDIDEENISINVGTPLSVSDDYSTTADNDDENIYNIGSSHTFTYVA